MKETPTGKAIRFGKEYGTGPRSLRDFATVCGDSKCTTPGHRFDYAAIEVVALKEKLMRDGYPKTAHAMEAAVKAVGWEIAEQRKAKKK